MPSLEEHHSATSTKMLLLGESGSGKTGALASLAKAGFNLRIADFDNGTDILRNLLLDDKPSLRRVNFIPFTDEFYATANGASLIPRTARAWPSFIQSLSKWENLSSIESWGENDVFVLDSLNFAGKAALRFIQQLNSRLANPPQWDDYREAQRLVESLCAKLYSTSIKCNVVCLSHIREIGKREDHIDEKGRVRTIEDPSSVKGFPETGTGRALSPTIGRYFNAVLMTDIVGTGASTRRVIRTQPHMNIGLKNSAPKKVKLEYPLENGLAEYFRAVRGSAKAEQTAAE